MGVAAAAVAVVVVAVVAAVAVAAAVVVAVVVAVVAAAVGEGTDEARLPELRICFGCSNYVSSDAVVAVEEESNFAHAISVYPTNEHAVCYPILLSIKLTFLFRCIHW